MILLSTNYANFAPLLNDSIARLPDPENKSKTTFPLIFSLIILNRFSLTLSWVGLVPSILYPSIFLPLYNSNTSFIDYFFC